MIGVGLGGGAGRGVVMVGTGSAVAVGAGDGVSGGVAGAGVSVGNVPVDATVAVVEHAIATNAAETKTNSHRRDQFTLPSYHMRQSARVREEQPVGRRRKGAGGGGECEGQRLLPEPFTHDRSGLAGRS